MSGLLLLLLRHQPWQVLEGKTSTLLVALHHGAECISARVMTDCIAMTRFLPAVALGDELIIFTTLFIDQWLSAAGRVSAVRAVRYVLLFLVVIQKFQTHATASWMLLIFFGKLREVGTSPVEFLGASTDFHNICKQ